MALPLRRRSRARKHAVALAAAVVLLASVAACAAWAFRVRWTRAARLRPPGAAPMGASRGGVARYVDERLRAGGAGASANAPQCAVLADTELSGAVVKWGAGTHLTTPGACCTACRENAGCNVWVHENGGGECWLKHRDSPWTDVDLLRGRSSRWSSGVLAAASDEPPLAAGGGTVGAPAAHDVVIATRLGEIRVRLRRRHAPLAAAFVDAVVAESAEDGKAAGLRFYRAEPVPPTWGSSDLPDTWDGGRWGPPYALLQGTLKPQGSTVKAAKADAGEGARPVVRRGMLAWAGGGGGPDFFCALADHPEVRRPRTSAHIASTHAGACLLCPCTHSQRSARARQSCSRPRLVFSGATDIPCGGRCWT